MSSRVAASKILRFYDDLVRLKGWYESKEEIFPVRPKTFHLFPSQLCNFKCDHCGYYSVQKLEKVSAQANPEFLLREIASIRPVSIHYSGYGEPTLYSNLTELVDRVRDLGIKQFISTNGTGQIELYKKFDSVRISLDASSVKTHSRVHGCSQSLSVKVFETVEKLLSHKNNEVGLAFLITPSNYKEVFEFVHQYKDKADFIQLRPAYGIKYPPSTVAFLESINFRGQNVSYNYKAWEQWLKGTKKCCYITPFNVVGYNTPNGFRYSLCQDRLKPSFKPPFESWWGKHKHRAILSKWSSKKFCSIKCPYYQYNEFFEEFRTSKMLGLDII